ncbi:hypothetical protein J5N97_010791 [Dioscorea zingiberensis]|uniref:Uncharacterized protein n=1 Tax=Dioscorea zingiberensis TaxID=325984 RepID=A0A9D5CZD7_9LILI|nr:hypothetical protein J5N97_010791 [Dioscorea zingiberensis]
MEMIVISGQQHRNQYYGRNNSRVANGFHSPSSFKGMNCRSFESSPGILPPPPKLHSFDSLPAPKSPFSYSEPPKQRKRSSPITIKRKQSPPKGIPFSDGFSASELWAGPAYTNSPPPSSLPIPKFSLRQKRTVSLELPIHEAGIKPHPVSKSAPSSPSGESRSDFFRDTASATENLRRILHLDIADD